MRTLILCANQKQMNFLFGNCNNTRHFSITKDNLVGLLTGDTVKDCDRIDYWCSKGATFIYFDRYLKSLNDDFLMKEWNDVKNSL